ncbi:hypothetical protein [Nocardia rhizosphaerae]|uniref:Uncharacterized protein n=1 Tax=Nocardia rhizosphaerae TaxID=1691571 RepID=A0ABV8KZR9_9NOCA
MGYPYGPYQGNDPYVGGYAGPYAQQGAPAYADPYAQAGAAAQPYLDPYAQPHPGYGYGYGAPGYAQQRVSGGTALTAASLSLLLAVVALVGMGISATMELNTSRADPAATLLGVSIAAIPVLLWLLGAILLFRRKTAGRVILIIMSTFGLVTTGIIAVAGVAGDAPLAVLIGVAIGALVPLIILLCAAAPATGRWIRAGRQQAYGQRPYY